MKIDLVSDLHVDRSPIMVNWKHTKNRGSTVLMVAGDVSNDWRDVVRTLKDAKDHYDRVLYVDGNHDHYQSTMIEGMTIQKSVEHLRNVLVDNGIHYLDSAPIHLDGVMFIGANGWYDFKFGAVAYTPEFSKSVWLPKEQLCEETGNMVKVGGSNDTELNFGEDSPESLSVLHAERLVQCVSDAQKDQKVQHIVVATHTMPLQECIAWDRNDPWNGAYGNTSMAAVVAADHNHKIKAWGFGHTHHATDRMISGIRFLSAPRGYGHQTDVSIYKAAQIDPDETGYVSAFGEIE